MCVWGTCKIVLVLHVCFLKSKSMQAKNVQKVHQNRFFTTTVKLPNQRMIINYSNQLAVISPCARKIISSPKPTDLPDNPLPPANHMHTNELANNQLGDDHSNELSDNQLTHNQQPDMTANCYNMLPNGMSNHELQLISKYSALVTTGHHTSKVDDCI